MTLIRAALALALSLGMATAALSQDVTLKLHHFLGPAAPSHSQMLVPWARQVEENSGGRIKIEIFPAMALGGRPPELIQQARDGIVDMIWTVNGYTPGLFPRTEVMELPNVYDNDPEAANLTLFDMFESDLKADYRGVEVMFLHVHAGNGIQMRDTAVRAPRDLAGKNMRIPTRTGAWVIEALGANPVAMPVPDLPQALQKGTVDGAFIPWEIIPPLKIQEQTQYQVEGAGSARFGTITFQLSMNAARWSALPEDLKQAFRDASDREWVAEVGRIYRATEDFGIDVATAAGNTHIVLSEAETAVFRETLEPVVDRWIAEATGKGIDGAALVAKARALIAENAGYREVGSSVTLGRRGICGAVAAICTVWAVLGGALLLVVVVVNVGSVLGAIVSAPFPGDFELTEMGVAVAVFSFLPYAQLAGAHVTADIFSERAGPRLLAVFRLAAAVVAVLVAAILVWRMSAGLVDQKAYNYTTTILQIPIWWAFVPVLVSLVLYAAAAAVTLAEGMAGARRA